MLKSISSYGKGENYDMAIKSVSRAKMVSKAFTYLIILNRVAKTALWLTSSFLGAKYQLWNPTLTLKVIHERIARENIFTLDLGHSKASWI